MSNMFGTVVIQKGTFYKTSECDYYSIYKLIELTFVILSSRQFDNNFHSSVFDVL